MKRTSPLRCLPIRRASRRRGYTAVEVLVALTLFSIGAAGVIGMLRATAQGNADARRFDIATSLANEWCARLRRDSMGWTQPNPANPASNLTTTTVWLKDATSLSPVLPGTLAANVSWIMPPTPAPFYGSSPAFDVLGRELGSNNPPFFCVNYRLDMVQLDATIRAEVRVFWPRFEQNPPATCDVAVANALNAPQLYHFVYATTLVRRNAT